MHVSFDQQLTYVLVSDYWISLQLIGLSLDSEWADRTGRALPEFLYMHLVIGLRGSGVFNILWKSNLDYFLSPIRTRSYREMPFGPE